MPLAPGTRLGPYEILASLGTGGMGEVYRARDTRLGRDVAIKTLPDGFAGDPERLARFEAEAKAVATLSHPNLLAIHDVGTEGGVTFAVTELVEGQTLRERLAEGPLSGPRAIAVAIQLAQGLAAAHDRGVIHRDLKPENVMLTPDGRAKILDFGLAKRESLQAVGSESFAPTMLATEPGAVLGTSGYMSPEQVRGLTVDARSDIFSLGVLLYEMVAGRRPFRGESSADVMTAILREDPAALTQLVPGTPLGLDRIVHRCLEKQPAARFRSAADLAFALEAVAAPGSSGSHAPVPAPEAAPARQPSFTRLTYRNGCIASARFTPDGAGVVYGAAWEGRPFEIFSSRPGSPESRSLGLPAGNLLAMSGAGELAVSVGYHHRYWFQVTGTLARVPLAGGGLRPLQKNVGHADWGPDGKSMAVVRYREGRCQLEYPAGRVLAESSEWLSSPRVSRDGKRVAYADHPMSGECASSICVVDAAGGRRELMRGMTNTSGICWSRSGEEIWVSGVNHEQRHGIWAVGLDGACRDVHVSPVRVTLHDLSRDGRTLISFGELRIGLGAGSDAGGPETNLSWFDGSVAADLSSDGRQVLLTEVDEAENPHYACYLREIDGSPAVRLGEGVANRLSPDGEWLIAVLIGPAPGLMLYPTGFGEPRPVPCEGIDRVVWAGFHPDGRRLFVVGSTAERPRRLYELPLAGGRPRLLWDEAVDLDWVGGAPISPDGERVVLRRASGELVMLTCATGEVRPLAGLGANEDAVRFDPSGRSLYVVGPSGDRRIERLDLESGERVPWQTLQPPDPTGATYVARPVVAADGTRYAYSYLRQLSNLYVVEGLE